MHHHLLPIGTHLIDEIQRLVNHRFFNEQRDRQIKQTEHQAIFPVCHQVIRMALSNAPHPVPNRHTMIGPAGMNDSPTILARHNGLVIHPAAHKQARINLDHTITASVSTAGSKIRPRNGSMISTINLTMAAGAKESPPFSSSPNANFASQYLDDLSYTTPSAFQAVS